MKRFWRTKCAIIAQESPESSPFPVFLLQSPKMGSIARANLNLFSSVQTWAIIAALLAVLTSILSAWTAQTALELQEDEKLPNPLVSFDLTSRYGVIQLRVTNNGGGSAHEIRLTWNTPLKNQRGNDVRFHDNPKLADIPILQPHETISVFIDGSHQFFQRYKDSNFTGEIEFRNASGKTTKRPFYMNSFRLSTLDEENLQKKSSD